ncbi:rhomboid family intramembrane serine protease [Limibaculum sp. FT325]|uniref:rhomboid family intramembrane serine protease n=1 Tax=Thermohalobaculum sediminis TaxID=2939436 RepID=UPI0020BEFBD6|nr:rhomboid family intramembrane serine protease [Limibaculum sediminis]MCL5776613.1 rhomboid family intramembrane serine protease [Limibaculum sediminis]
MSESPAFWPRPAEGVPVHPVLWTMLGVMVALEGLMTAADHGLAPQIFHRVWIYTMFAFFDVQFELARAGIAVEPQLIWSFVTYAFLHGGWLHLALNGAVFLALGHGISRSIGIGRTVGLFLITAAAGALVFALIAETRWPLVGASGAVFGFLGTATAWRLRALRAVGLSTAPVWRLVAGLVAINAVMAFGFTGLGGALAWEAHLGGFVAGWLMARVWPPRPWQFD